MKYKLLIPFFLFSVMYHTAFTQFTKLYDFDYFESGGFPLYVALVSDGTYLYGTAANGGLNQDGTIYKIKPDGTGFEKLFDFEEEVSGNQPESGVIYDGEYLYGNTKLGGLNGFGTIYKIKPDGSGFTTLKHFAEGEASSLRGVLYDDGIYLYGISSNGGGENGGTLYRIKKDGSDYSLLHNFELATGAFPYGGVISDGTYLYGMTTGGGIDISGTIFKILPDGTEFSVITYFTGNPDGAAGYSSLAFDGTFLYGMTNNGGTSNFGTIFKVKTDGTEYQKLHDFNLSNGGAPLGSLILVGTTLYGIAGYGPEPYLGEIFQIETDGSDFNIIFSFDGANSGAGAFATLFYESGALFGVAKDGGADESGTIFRYGEIIIEDPIYTITTNAFQLYPNPATNNFNLIVDEHFISPNTVMEIINMQGAKIYASPINSMYSEFDISGIATGMYFVKVISGHNTSLNQIIIE